MHRLALYMKILVPESLVLPNTDIILMTGNAYLFIMHTLIRAPTLCIMRQSTVHTNVSKL
jgi:hypothetical protein